MKSNFRKSYQNFLAEEFSSKIFSLCKTAVASLNWNEVKHVSAFWQMISKNFFWVLRNHFFKASFKKSKKEKETKLSFLIFRKWNYERGAGPQGGTRKARARFAPLSFSKNEEWKFCFFFCFFWKMLWKNSCATQKKFLKSFVKKLRRLWLHFKSGCFGKKYNVPLISGFNPKINGKIYITENVFASHWFLVWIQKSLKKKCITKNIASVDIWFGSKNRRKAKNYFCLNMMWVWCLFWGQILKQCVGYYFRFFFYNMNKALLIQFHHKRSRRTCIFPMILRYHKPHR